MKKLVLASLTVLAVLLCSSAGWADWNVGDPHKMHYPQLPDRSPVGIDVDARSTLADDFLCTKTGPITDIHIWSSFRNDLLPPTGLPESLAIRLSIHEDIPMGPGGYSQPGLLLWEYIANPLTYRVRSDGHGPEGWWTPWENIYEPNNHFGLWQYNFYIDPQLAFVQEAGRIYWLDVQLLDPGVMWGWKTSIDYFNDDAVYWDPIMGGWKEMRYPPGHPMYGQSVDLAFVITPEPGSLLALSTGLSGFFGISALLRRRR